jgi:hypothetical protein
MVPEKLIKLIKKYIMRIHKNVFSLYNYIFLIKIRKEFTF